jgi:hypothetical protein
MTHDWTTEEEYWRSNYNTRPYARGKDFDTLSSGYRYGFESANRYPGRGWNDVESDLAKGWNTYQYRGESTWEQIKDAARDAWDHVTGRQSRTV